MPDTKPEPPARKAPNLFDDVDADLVDRIFDYMVELMPEISAHARDVKEAVRDEFGGASAYIRRRRRNEFVAAEVLSLFNGRNATEVARRLRIGRATVYRMLKQSGK